MRKEPGTVTWLGHPEGEALCAVIAMLLIPGASATGRGRLQVRSELPAVESCSSAYFDLFPIALYPSGRTVYELTHYCLNSSKRRPKL